MMSHRFKTLSTYSGPQCLPFLKTTDVFDGLAADLGNMSGNWPFMFNGRRISTSEHLYVCGFFSDGSPEQDDIQQQVLAQPNAMLMKHQYRRGMAAAGRKDFDDADWRFEWMLYCVWCKVQGNFKFMTQLKAVPADRIIIENSNRDGRDPLWGCFNEEVKGLMRQWKRDHRDSFAKAAEKDLAESAYRISVSGRGQWVGYNVLGKILMVCRDALQAGTAPDIDMELLRAAKIHFDGRQLFGAGHVGDELLKNFGLTRPTSGFVDEDCEPLTYDYLINHSKDT